MICSNRYENIAWQSRGGGHYTLKNTKIKIATLNKHCSASVDTMNFVLHHLTHQHVPYGHLEFHARRSNDFWENGRQSWNIWSNLHFSNGSQWANIDGMNLAEQHIRDWCMCKRTCNFRTSGPNSYKNIAWRSRAGGHYTLKNMKTTIFPWKIIVQWQPKYQRTQNFMRYNFASTMRHPKLIFLPQNSDFVKTHDFSCVRNAHRGLRKFWKTSPKVTFHHHLEYKRYHSILYRGAGLTFHRSHKYYF